jgi:hypothetical protein
VSLDMYVETRVVDHGTREARESWECVREANVTYNLAPLYRELLADRFDGGFWEELRRREDAKLPAGDFAPLFRDALKELRRRHDELIHLLPSNGWGNFEWARGFLLRMGAACRLYPNARVRSWR